MNSTSGWIGEKVLFLKGEYTEYSDMYTLELKMVVLAFNRRCQLIDLVT